MALPPIFRAIIHHDTLKPVLSGPVVSFDALKAFKEWKARRRSLVEKALLYRSPMKPTK